MTRPYVIVHAIASANGRVSLGPGRTAFDDIADERREAISGSATDLTASTLRDDFLPESVVDDPGLVSLPALIGGSSTPVLFGRPDLGSEDLPTRLELASLEQCTGGRVHLRYRVMAGEV